VTRAARDCHQKIDRLATHSKVFDAIGRAVDLTLPAARLTLKRSFPMELKSKVSPICELSSGDTPRYIMRQFCRKLLGYAYERQLATVRRTAAD